MRFKEFFLLEEISNNVDLTGIAKLLPYSCNAARKARRGSKPHVRLTYRGDDFEKFISSHIDVSLEVSSTGEASGSFPTWEATATSNIKAGDKVLAKEGDSFYIVNNVSDKSKIVRKEFEPKNFGLATSKEWKSHEIIEKVEDSLKDKKFDHLSQDEKDYMVDCMTKVKSGKDTISFKAPDSLNKRELEQIGINFGEILSAIWALHKFDGDSIKFPTNVSQALIDFNMITGDAVRGFSAKSGKGAAPSMKPVAEFIKKNRKLFHNFPIEKIETILALQNETVMNGFLLGNQMMRTPGFRELEKIVKFKLNEFTIDHLEKWLRQFESTDDIVNTLKPFSNVIKRTASRASIEKIIKLNYSRAGIIISPIGYHLAKMMNDDTDFDEILSTAAKKMDVTQIYTDITPSEIKITLKDFKDSHFEWICTVNANNPGNNRMSFKVKL